MNQKSIAIRRATLELMVKYGGTHFGGSLSCIEILMSIFDNITTNDMFILSKGHSCWPYYILLKEKGYNPRIEAHPHRDIYNGIPTTTGSLGHGLPFGLGVALAKKLKEETGKVIILLGDGECQEGTFWETLLYAGTKRLDNLSVLVDMNMIQGSGYNTTLTTKMLLDIGTSCNWNTTIIDGHNIDTITKILTEKITKPTLVIAETIKGKGISFMENQVAWHSKPLSAELYKTAIEELK